MYQGKPTRRDFLIGAGGLVAIAKAVAPSLSAQAEPIRGFQSLRQHAIKLYDEVESYTYQRDEKGNFIPRLGQESKFPYLFDGEMAGKKTSVLVDKDLPRGPYSLEAKTYFNREDIPFGGNADLDDLAELFLFPTSSSNAFLDRGIKGNLHGRADAMTTISMNPRGVGFEYSMFTGDGGYYLAHFTVPKNEEDIQKRIKIITDGLAKLKISERDSEVIVGALTSLNSVNNAFGHSPNVMAILLDGVAWYAPSGVVQAYWDFRINGGMKANVGRQPRLIGSYSGTSHAELQRRREQAIANGDKQNKQILQMTLDNLVAEGKISLQ